MLHVAQSAIVEDVIVAVDPLLSHLDIVCLLALRNGGHHLRARARARARVHRYLDRHWIPSRPREQAKPSQDHLLKVLLLGRRGGWFHMVMGLQILDKGERECVVAVVERLLALVPLLIYLLGEEDEGSSCGFPTLLLERLRERERERSGYRIFELWF